LVEQTMYVSPEFSVGQCIGLSLRMDQLFLAFRDIKRHQGFPTVSQSWKQQICTLCRAAIIMCLNVGQVQFLFQIQPPLISPSCPFTNHTQFLTCAACSSTSDSFSRTGYPSPCDDGSVCLDRSQFCNGVRECIGNDNDEINAFCFTGKSSNVC
jgi:hypothetical protein